MRVFTDMMGNEVVLGSQPQRIISLVPSQTELLYDLGLGGRVAGITKFCVHPAEWFRSKPRVGGTKTVKMDIVRSLSPDLIIANKEENTREQVEELAALFPVWVSDIRTVDDGLAMIRAVGELTGAAGRAAQLAAEISEGFAGLAKAPAPGRVAYFIWRKPWMCAGGDTFISNMLAHAGWENACGHLSRYPELQPEAIAGLDASIVLLSSEPYPFREQHIAEIKELLPRAAVRLADGEMFSWYGSRMRYAPAYIQTLISSL